MEPIILASSSPRRQEILKRMNIPYAVVPADIEEIIPEEIGATEAPEYLAAKKVEAVARRLTNNQEVGWILGADTIIYQRGKIYGKPKSPQEASDFLRELSGTTHKVITGIVLYNGKLHDFTSRTSINKVTFAEISEDTIEWYINTNEWHGAAGGYKIQGMASIFISKIEGTESSIMGLPIHELYDMLVEQNYQFTK